VHYEDEKVSYERQSINMSGLTRRNPRSVNLFKLKDVVRAMRSAKAGGMESIGAVEIVTAQGTTIRVFGAGEAECRNELDDWMAKKNARPA
jgi:hypothetical protein